MDHQVLHKLVESVPAGAHTFNEAKRETNVTLKNPENVHISKIEFFYNHSFLLRSSFSYCLVNCIINYQDL